MTDLKLFCAPVQGHTDHAYRMIHSEVYGPADAYFTPFIRVEKGELRRRDVADFTASREAGLPVVAQVIFRDADELNILLSGLTAAGADEIDLNMGCPFPLQTARGRGAATIGNRKLMEDVKRCVAAFPDVRFSMKIRLGMTSPDEWRETIDIINRLPLTHLTVHPGWHASNTAAPPTWTPSGASSRRRACRWSTTATCALRPTPQIPTVPSRDWRD